MSATGVGELFFTSGGTGDVLFSRPETFVAQCPTLRRVSHAVLQRFDEELRGRWAALCNWTAVQPSADLEREIHIIDATLNLNAMKKFARVSRLFEERGVDRKALFGNGYLPCQSQDVIRLQEALQQLCEDRALVTMWPNIMRYTEPFLPNGDLFVKMRACQTAAEMRECLEDDAVRQCLRFLECQKLAIQCLPPVIGNCTDLHQIDFANNQLVTLPEEIGLLTNLSRLDFSFNQLVTLPEGIGLLTNLETIHLGENRLAALPAAFGNLTQLQELDLGHNQFAVCPGIGGCVQLQDLSFNHNPLVTFPREMGQLTNLEKLHLNDNRLERLPEEIGQLHQLTELHLSNNRLTELPAAFGNLTGLQELRARNNQFAGFPGIGGCAQLGMLDLGYNQIAEIPPTLGNLTSLTGLTLRGNQIATLPAVIGDLARLRSLSLQDNQLAVVPAELGRLEQLMLVGLGGNPILFTFNEAWQKITSADLEGGNKEDFGSVRWSLPAGREFFNEAIESFRNYPCQSPFAAFYQQLCLTGCVDPELFYASVPERERKLIYGVVYRLAQEEQGEVFPGCEDPQWGQHHAFEDRRRFCFAVRSVVEQFYKELSSEECPSLDNPLVAIDAVMASRGS